MGHVRPWRSDVTARVAALMNTLVEVDGWLLLRRHEWSVWEHLEAEDGQASPR
jgi:hypothetical protein